MAAVYWLQPRKHLERVLRWVEVLTVVFVVGALLGGFVFHAWAQAQVETPLDAQLEAQIETPVGQPAGAQADGQLRLLQGLLLIGGLAVCLIIPIVWPATRALRRRLGTDGANVYLRFDDGSERALPATAIVHTRQAILCGRYSFPLRNQRGRSLYREGEIETNLEPLLRQAVRLTAWQGLKHQWRNRDPLLLWPLGSVLAMSLLLGLVTVLQQRYPAP